MKKFVLILLFFLFLSNQIFASSYYFSVDGSNHNLKVDGSNHNLVVQYTPLSTDYNISVGPLQRSGKGIYEVTYNIQTASDGSIPAMLLPDNKGKYLLQVDAFATPGGTAPDAADLVVYDENGVYYIVGNGVNLIHPTIPKSCVPDMNSVINHYWPIRGALYYDILNQATPNANITLDFVFTE